MIHSSFGLFFGNSEKHQLVATVLSVVIVSVDGPATILPNTSNTPLLLYVSIKRLHPMTVWFSSVHLTARDHVFTHIAIWSPNHGEDSQYNFCKLRGMSAFLIYAPRLGSNLFGLYQKEGTPLSL